MSNPGDLQFDRAEPTAAAGGPQTCTVCKRPLEGTYYAINGRAVCPTCHAQVAQHAASGSFVTALLLGLGAAALGAGIYFGIEALTGYEFGLVAVIVGLMVGTAVRKGSRGQGGWRYQALAIGLTYLSVVVTDSSLVVKQLISERGARADSTAVATARNAPSDATSPTVAPSDVDSLASSTPATSPRTPYVAFLALFGLVLAMPFLIGFSNPLHFVIVGFALYEAWKLNRIPAFTITGPHQLAPAP